MDSPQAACAISKYKLLENFLELLHFSHEIREKLQLQLSDLDSLTYAKCKSMAENYQLAWQELKSNYFQKWTSKPMELLEFTRKVT